MLLPKEKAGPPRKPSYLKGHRWLHAYRVCGNTTAWNGPLIVGVVGVLWCATPTRGVLAAPAVATFTTGATVTPAAPGSGDPSFNLRILRIRKLLIRLQVIPKASIPSPPAGRFISILGADSDGKLLDGENCYALHLAPADVPPRTTDWSLALYQTDPFRGPPVLGSRWLRSDSVPRYNPDGSLDIAIQRRRPKVGEAGNWLPAPDGTFNLVARLSSHGEQGLDWHVPPPWRVDARAPECDAPAPE
jgi:hypothetical protein